MFEFNSDGSIKLPDKYANKKEEEKNKLESQHCMKVRRDIVNHTSPKKCMLRITLSKKITNNSFIDTIYKYFQQNSEVPTKFTQINDKEFEIEIGTCFRRCSDCNSLIGRYREHMDGNLIDEKGTCTYENKRENNFCYEDYFD